MNRISELKHQFSYVFTDEQARVLAEVFHSSYKDLVKSSDFKHLTSVVSKLAETQKEVRNLAKQVGGLSEAFGGSLEEFALDLVPELLEKYWNLKIISCSREEVKYENKSIEFDLYIEGFIQEKKTIVLGEVKSHITKEEVLKFYKLVEKVKPIYTDADIKVVFFGYRAYREVRELIESLGGYMIFSNTKKI